MKDDVRKWMPWATMIVDVLLINLALPMAYWLRYDLQLFRSVDPSNNVPYSAYFPMAGLLTIVLVLSNWRGGAYDLRRSRSPMDELYTIVTATTTAIMLLVVLVFFYRRLFYSRIIFIYAGVITMLLLGLARLVRRAIMTRLRQAGQGVDRIVIVGAGEVGRAVMRNFMAQPDLGYRVVGFLDDDPAKGGTDIGPFKALGPLENLRQVMHEHAINQVVITLPWQYYLKTMRLATEAQQAGVTPRVVPDLFQLSPGGVDVEDINGIPLISIKRSSLTGWNQTLKRAFDLVVGSLLLVIIAPIWLLIALAIRLDSPGPVLFRQLRAGRDGQPFTFYKFRSMCLGAETQIAELRDKNEAVGPMFKMRDDPRRTRVGCFIRKYSLDELPQLINVLRGEMSLVGPRPALLGEVEQYREWQRKRLTVQPGMTGLWQVSGRSDLTFDEMAMLDIYYGENWSLGLDMQILLRTAPQLLFGDGAY